MRLAVRFGRLVCLAASAASAACLTMSRVTNLDDASCRSTLTTAISTILVGQHELPEVADWLAADAVRAIVPTEGRYRPFTVSSPSGTDYTFIFQLRKEGCLLRLCSRQRGSSSYTNELTYIATQPLPGCTCEGNVGYGEWRDFSFHGGSR
ncbi:MAG: hypothetical protein LAO05_16750 [Acidobacteriia bacterium]|nr:hypothetical protein [Terriglobia bacterium]